MKLTHKYKLESALFLPSLDNKQRIGPRLTFFCCCNKQIRETKNRDYPAAAVAGWTPWSWWSEKTNSAWTSFPRRESVCKVHFSSQEVVDPSKFEVFHAVNIVWVSMVVGVGVGWGRRGWFSWGPLSSPESWAGSAPDGSDCTRGTVIPFCKWTRHRS